MHQIGALAAKTRKCRSLWECRADSKLSGTDGGRGSEPLAFAQAPLLIFGVGYKGPPHPTGALFSATVLVSLWLYATDQGEDEVVNVRFRRHSAWTRAFNKKAKQFAYISDATE